ncbi:MAG: hypothetical protein ABSF69_15510 [Polyangiaceae bacterium]
MSRRWRRTLAVGMVAWLSSTLGLLAGPAWAGSGRVILVRPTAADDTIGEALNRVRGELVAEGFDVAEVDVLPDLAPPTPGSATPEDAALATIDLSVEEGAHVVDLRVIDRITNKTVIRRTPVESGTTSSTAEVLAVRAVELLRASLLELLLESRPSAPNPNATAVSEVRHASKWAAQGLPHEREPVWAVEVGALVVTDLGGIPPAVLALARIRRALFGPLSLRATVAGLGTEMRAASAAGEATVTQNIGLIECVASLWAAAVIHPFVSIGGGILYTSVEGHAVFPYQAQSNPPQWSAAADASLGAEVKLGRRFALSLEGHALLAQPYPVVQLLGADVARTGHPAILGSLSVVGWL